MRNPGHRVLKGDRTRVAEQPGRHQGAAVRGGRAARDGLLELSDQGGLRQRRDRPSVASLQARPKPTEQSLANKHYWDR
jgi:hypothetical protein